MYTRLFIFLSKYRPVLIGGSERLSEKRQLFVYMYIS